MIKNIYYFIYCMFFLWLAFFSVRDWHFYCIFFVLLLIASIILYKKKVRSVWRFAIPPVIYLFEMFLFCVFAMAVLLIYNSPSDEYFINDLNKYQVAIKKERWYLRHFPKEIPDNAQNPSFYYSDRWFGNGYTNLYFKTNKEYIDNELKKYKFTEIIEPYLTSKFDKIRPFIHDYKDENIHPFEYKIYVLSPPKSRIPRGIAVKEDTNEIIYYYYVR